MKYTRKVFKLAAAVLAALVILSGSAMAGETFCADSAFYAGEAFCPDETLTEGLSSAGDGEYFIDGLYAEDVYADSACQHIAVPYDDIQPALFSFGRTGGSYCALCWQELETPTYLPLQEIDGGVLYMGMSGNEVSQLQAKLRELGFLQFETDGYFDYATYAAVMLFQAESEWLPVTGMVDEATMYCLRWGAFSFYDVTFGMTGSAVSLMQESLKNLGYLQGAVDGYFGYETLTALRRYQSINEMQETGTGDLLTMEMLALGWGKWIETLNVGSFSDNVTYVQNMLRKDGFYWLDADGFYGILVEPAVKLFKIYNGIEDTDGEVDLETYYLFSSEHKSFYELVEGSAGIPVLMAQKQLKKLGYLEKEPDGIYDHETSEAMAKFQQVNVSYETGIGDGWSLIVLFSSFAVSKPFEIDGLDLGNHTGFVQTEDGTWIFVLNGEYTDDYTKMVLTDSDEAAGLKRIFCELYAKSVINSITDESMSESEKLWAAFQFTLNEFASTSHPRVPHYRGDDWVYVYAYDMFGPRHGGNCFSYAAAFAVLAKACGCEEVYACNSGGHGWTEVNGLVYDPEQYHDTVNDIYAFSYYNSTISHYWSAISGWESNSWQRVWIEAF